MLDIDRNLAAHHNPYDQLPRLFAVPGHSAEGANGDQWPTVISSTSVCPPDCICTEGILFPNLCKRYHLDRWILWLRTPQHATAGQLGTAGA